MILVVGDSSAVALPMPWPLRVADAWGMAVCASGFTTAMDGWLASPTWLRVPGVTTLILSFGGGDARTSPDGFVAAIAAMVYNARARWPDARILVTTPPRPTNARARRWFDRVRPVLAARMAAEAVDVIEIGRLSASDSLSIASAVLAHEVTRRSG